MASTSKRLKDAIRDAMARRRRKQRLVELARLRQSRVVHLQLVRHQSKAEQSRASLNARRLEGKSSASKCAPHRPRQHLQKYGGNHAKSVCVAQRGPPSRPENI